MSDLHHLIRMDFATKQYSVFVHDCGKMELSRQINLEEHMKTVRWTMVICMYSVRSCKQESQRNSMTVLPRKDRHVKHAGVDAGLRRFVTSLMQIQVLELLGEDQVAHGGPIGEHLCTSCHQVTSTQRIDKRQENVWRTQYMKLRRDDVTHRNFSVLATLVGHQFDVFGDDPRHFASDPWCRPRIYMGLDMGRQCCICMCCVCIYIYVPIHIHVHSNGA